MLLSAFFSSLKKKKITYAFMHSLVSNIECPSSFSFAFKTWIFLVRGLQRINYFIFLFHQAQYFFFFAFRYNWRAKTLPFTWILWEHCEVNNPLSILMCLGSRKSQGNGKRRWVASQREDTLGSLTCHLQPVRTYTTFIKVSL